MQIKWSKICLKTCCTKHMYIYGEVTTKQISSFSLGCWLTTEVACWFSATSECIPGAWRPYMNSVLLYPHLRSCIRTQLDLCMLTYLEQESRPCRALSPRLIKPDLPPYLAQDFPLCIHRASYSQLWGREPKGAFWVLLKKIYTIQLCIGKTFWPALRFCI